MSRRLIGILTDPSGTPLAGWTLILDARRNSAPTVPLGSRESVVLDGSGGYDLLITDGLYMALLTAPGDTVQRRLGLFLVAPGTDIDILTLIGLYTPAGSPGIDGSAAVSAHVALTDPHTQYATDTDLSAHTGNTSNPHSVTKAQVGLGSADNTSDASKPVSTAQQTALNLKQDTSAKDASGGYAGLTLLKLNLRNAANTITSFFTTAATVARTWTLPDKDGTVAMLSDSSYLGEYPFATIPSASGNARKLATLTDSAFGPGVLVQSNGTLWRPVNGSAVLAMRSGNPVTVQNTTGAVADTMGPFPGGLVRAGMRLELDVTFSTSGKSTGTVSAYLRIGNTAPETFAWNRIAPNNFFKYLGRINGTVSVTSDTSALHNGSMGIVSGSFEFGSIDGTDPTVDFSQPWIAEVFLQSAAETAINITGATWVSSVATITATAHTLAVGDKTTIASVNPSGYNGVVIVATVPNANTFTYALASDPGAYVSGGTSSRISNVASKSYVLTLFG